MAILAHFEELGRAVDRRSSPRRSLRLDVAGQAPTSKAAQASIQDLSRTGALLETPARLAVGEAFYIELPHAGAVEATVVWNSGRFYGCQFKQPIAAAALSAALLRAHPGTPGGAAPTKADLANEVQDLNDQVERMLRDMDRALKHLRDEDR